MKKVALITGGTGGLGMVLTQDLIELGYHAVSISRNEEKIEKAKMMINSPKAVFLQGDITKEEDVSYVYRYILDNYGYLDVLINNVGAMAGGGLEDISPDAFARIMELNVNAPYRVTHRMLRLLKRAEHANVVNISSIASEITGGCMAYSASKAAMDMMTKSLAKDLASYYIRVNSVNPGVINTKFQVTNHLMEANDYESFLQNCAKSYPLGTGTAKDVANLVEFLISDKARWITGANYIIDGGRSVNL